MSTTYIRDTRSDHIFSTAYPQYYTESNYQKLSLKVGKAGAQRQARDELLSQLKPGDKVWTVLRHVSSSGMSRDIDLYIFRDNEPVCLSGLASTLLDWPLSKKRGIKVQGCGMDMGFHLVYTLARVLFRDLPSEKDAGYSLHQEWL